VSMIYHIPDPPEPADSWAKAYVINEAIADLYAEPIEKLIADRGGWLFAADGKRERTTVMGVHIDERA